MRGSLAGIGSTRPGATTDPRHLPPGRIAPPDPYLPVLAGANRSTNSCRPAQWQRRARLLAAARTLIGRDGVDGVTIRQVADISGLSVQTIYNLVGNRAELVEAAIAEHILTCTRQAGTLDVYPCILLAIADLTWMNAAHNSQYARHATIGCNAGNFAVYRNVCRRNALLLGRLLNRRYGSRIREQNLDVGALAMNVTALAGSIALEWAREFIGLPEMRYRLASAYAMPLASLAPTEEIAAVNQWLAHIRVPPRTLNVAGAT